MEGELGLPRRRHREAGRVTVPLLAQAGRGRGHLHGQVLHRRLGAPLRRPLARAGRPDDVRAGREREDHLRGRDAGRALPHHLRLGRARRRHLVHGPLPRLGLRRRPARARRLDPGGARPARLPLPPLRAGAPPRGHDHDQGRAARGRDDRGRRATATATIPGAGARISPSGITTGSARRSRPASSRAP